MKLLPIVLVTNVAESTIYLSSIVYGTDLNNKNDNTIIDKVNILQATYLAMHQAIDNLKQKPELLLIDGNRFKPYNNIEHQTIIKGDATYVEIAAASILAKTYRDELMLAYDSQFPKYQWQKNKGYPTPEHKKAVWTFGYTPLHRITFNINKQLSLF